MIIDNALGGLEKINEVVSRKGNILYIMKGIFTEFGVRNRNDRVYTAEKFLPHLSELLERKKLLKVVYGEFDHPDVFDTSLSRISHAIENAWYIKENNRVDGEIRLTNTFYGKEAKALVDDDLPIFVSSRAAGVTESNGEVTVKKLFTYDCVADPGFSSARMELKNMNESLGFNENQNFWIFEISNESKINELFNMEKNENGTQTKLEEFKSYLDEELLKTKKSIDEALLSKNFEPDKLNRLYEEFETLSEGQKKMTQYLDHIADAINVLVQENNELKEKVQKNKEKTKLVIQHSDHIAEAVEKTINYMDYLAGTTDKVIDYQKYIAEKLDNGISFIEYVAEHTENSIKYSEYIAENFDKIADYADYIAEHLDKNIMYSEYVAETVDNLVDYTEYIGESADKIVDYAQYIAEHVDNAIKYVEYVAEGVDNNIRYSEYIAENLTDSIAYQKYNAEVLDRTIENQKQIVEKLNEGKETPIFEAIGDMTADDPSDYYDEKPAEIPTETPTEEPVQTEEPTEETPAEETPAEETTPEDIEGVSTEEVPQTQEGEEELGITPGMVVKVGEDEDARTGEVLATNDDNKIVVLKMGDTGEEVEVAQEKVHILGTTKVYENKNQLTNDIKKLIEEAKKRNASKTEDPHFLLFLSEKKKAAYYGLSDEDKEKVNFIMNENKDNYANEGDVLSLMQKALFKPTKTVNEMLVEGIPSDLKPIWENLNPKVQESILESSQFYANLTEEKVESFWLTRDLLSYAKANSGKKVLNENINTYDNYKLSDDQLEHYKNILNRY